MTRHDIESWLSESLLAGILDPRGLFNIYIEKIDPTVMEVLVYFVCNNLKSSVIEVNFNFLFNSDIVGGRVCGVDFVISIICY